MRINSNHIDKTLKQLEQSEMVKRFVKKVVGWVKEELSPTQATTQIVEKVIEKIVEKQQIVELETIVPQLVKVHEVIK